MLTSRISVPASTETPEQEDIFASALHIIFTDDTQISHGTPGQSVIYRSPRYGDITLKIPAHPDVEEGRKLFAHYLWNAGVIAAAAIEEASTELPHSDDTQAASGDSQKHATLWSRKFWDMRGQHVLELGAGTALPSLIAALSNAASVTISDHPTSPAIVTDTIAGNVATNLSSAQENIVRTSSSKISIHGYTWGQDNFHSATSYGKPSAPQPLPNSFNKIIIADCLWMPSQHANLVKTVLTYLSETPNPSSPSPGQINCALVVAGFHTGRSIVSNFFRVATGSRTAGVCVDENDQEQCTDQRSEDRDSDDEDIRSVKGSLRAVSIFEIDVDYNIRPWQAIRLGENKDQAKKWCVCAVLAKKD